MLKLKFGGKIQKINKKGKRSFSPFLALIGSLYGNFPVHLNLNYGKI